MRSPPTPTLVSIDTETALIQPGLLAPPIACLSVSSDTFDAVHVDNYSERLRELFASYDIVVGQNIAYDFGVLAAHDPGLLPDIFELYDEGRVRDTKINEQLIDIAQGKLKGGYSGDEWVAKGYSLKDLAKLYFKKDLDKTTHRLGFGDLIGVPLEQWPAGAEDYAKEDAVVTRQIYLAQQHYDHFLEDAGRQAKAAWALHLMSLWGIRTDKNAVEALRLMLETQAGMHREELKRAGFIRADGTKDMGAIKKRVEEKLPDPPRTEKGAVKTDEETLLKTGDAELKALSEFSSVEKIRTTYIPVLESGVDVPINANFSVLVESGRTSCSRPNLQNLPRMPGVRECFTPRPGFLFCSVDYDTLELRTLAQVCLWVVGESKLADALRGGVDPHLDLAAQLLRIPYEEAVKRKKEPTVKEMRQLAKAGNFGFPGGMGQQKFRVYAKNNYGMDISAGQAAALREAWFRRWPEMQGYFNFVKKQMPGGIGTIKQFKSNRIRGLVGFNDGANTLFQGLAADGAKEALYEVQKACFTLPKSPLYGSRSVVFAHDEIIAEVPEEKAHEASFEISKIMCDTMARWVPDVPITATPALMYRWSKNAEPSWSVENRLVPWGNR